MRRLADIRLTLNDTTAVGGTLEMSTDRVAATTDWKIENLSAKDITTSPTRIEVTVRNMDDPRIPDQIIFAAENPAADELVFTDHEFRVYEGEKIVVKFYGSAVGDQTVVYIRGEVRSTINLLELPSWKVK